MQAGAARITVDYRLDLQPTVERMAMETQ
jgi:hypothetical protein